MLSLMCHAGSQDEEVLILHKTRHMAIWRFPACPAQPISTASQAQASDSTSAPSPAEHALPSSASRQASSASEGTSAELRPDSKEDAQAEATDPQLMAFTTLRFKAYSAARSPDGRLVAAGEGLLQSHLECM